MADTPAQRPRPKIRDEINILVASGNASTPSRISKIRDEVGRGQAGTKTFVPSKIRDEVTRTPQVTDPRPRPHLVPTSSLIMETVGPPSTSSLVPLP